MTVVDVDKFTVLHNTDDIMIVTDKGDDIYTLFYVHEFTELSLQMYQ